MSLRKAAEMAVNVLLDPKSRADECADAVQTLRQALTTEVTPKVDAVNISQKRVDEIAKCKHEEKNT